MTHNTFHVALYVEDIDAAVERHRKILGIEPAKGRHDHAKFEVADPPVILSLNAQTAVDADLRGFPGQAS